MEIRATGRNLTTWRDQNRFRMYETGPQSLCRLKKIVNKKYIYIGWDPFLDASCKKFHSLLRLFETFVPHIPPSSNCIDGNLYVES